MNILIEPKVLTENEIKSCLEHFNVDIEEYMDVEIELPANYSRFIRRYNKAVNHYCCCKKGFGVSYKSDICPFCNKTKKRKIEFYNEEIRNKFEEAAEEFKKSPYFSSYSLKELKVSKKEQINYFFLISKHPDYENGIVIKRVSLSFTNKKDILVISDTVSGIVEVVPGVESKSYAYKKGVKVEIPAFEALNIHSKMIKDSLDVYWTNAKGMIDFLSKNSVFANRTGIIELLSSYNSCSSFNGVFLIYMALFTAYPIIEQLIKMGFSNLVKNAFDKIAYSSHVDGDTAISNLGKVFNPHGTSGTAALPLPKYVVTYLRNIDASLDTIETWIDLFEFENISKETFAKLCVIDKDSCSYYLKRCVGLLKYGYKIEKLANYVSKQSDVINSDKNQVLRLLEDYHSMVEQLNAEHDLFPSNVRTAHNNIQASYKMKKEKIKEELLKTVASEAIKFIPSSKEFEDYVIKIPETVYDFVNEGSKQHNCVASYVQRVASKETLVFFIRKAKEPDEAYITAEYKYGRIQQVMEKNNRRTTNTIALKMAETYAEKLKNSAFFKHI